ncbi:pyridoxamine 5'-phosphate oxidase family protein [Serinicoccus kebangsaanensis]|uniref:pyridoxamine 5'-phosphate oxidase family protein n=1 Tax=Serinicoccus kebangsaanensis TaxID=2602069 RepID=UPI00124CA256|nr:pyridoxamine 5'-phosphate oxidase family protein [Serinicoccus kebangsaanensis]
MDEETFDEEAARAFLAEPHVGVLAVSADGGPPAATPLWYAVEPDGAVWLVTSATTRKARLLAASGAATLVVHTVSPRTRFVSVDLELTDRAPATAKESRAIAARYLSGEALEGYLAFAAESLGPEERLTFTPTRYRYADLTM